MHDKRMHSGHAVCYMKQSRPVPAFIPATLQEMDLLGWKALDVILVTGDAYIDAPHIGVAVIGKVLMNAGWRVGIIAQPDVSGGVDIARLGEPELFWGVTSGCVDSMIANYTASGKRRKKDDLTPGGLNDRRPDRAVIVYSNLIRRYFKNTKPVVLGGIEASLRRVSHYDAWSDSVRRSVLFDARAEFLAYGMAEQSILELAEKLHQRAGNTLDSGHLLYQPGYAAGESRISPTGHSSSGSCGRRGRQRNIHPYVHGILSECRPCGRKAPLPETGHPVSGSESSLPRACARSA